MFGIGFAGTFSARLEMPVRAHLDMPCNVIVADEVEIVARLSEVDVLVTLALTPHVSGWTEGTLGARAKLIAENIHRIARGELPVNLIAPSE